MVANSKDTTSRLIETGVDRLVSLVRENGKISAQDAARQINVSLSVIMEWAEFLEEEGIINLEYKITKPFLVERKLTKKEIEDKTKDFQTKREVFVRKSEISINFLEKQAESIRNIKEEFDSLKKKFGIEVETVKKDLAELERYEEMRQKAAENLRQQRNDSKENIDKIIVLKELDKSRKQFVVRNEWSECLREGKSRVPLRHIFSSSRRRHTRCSRDWSSDVCSSDL